MRQRYGAGNALSLTLAYPYRWLLGIADGLRAVWASLNRRTDADPSALGRAAGEPLANSPPRGRALTSRRAWVVAPACTAARAAPFPPRNSVPTCAGRSVCVPGHFAGHGRSGGYGARHAGGEAERKVSYGLRSVTVTPSTLFLPMVVR